MPATLAEIGTWAASFDTAVVCGGVDPEHFSCWMHLFGDAENSIRIYREAPVATPALH